jgi:hypothetical protein
MQQGSVDFKTGAGLKYKKHFMACYFIILLIGLHVISHVLPLLPAIPEIWPAFLPSARCYFKITPNRA